jgi:hypothetical protein
LFSVADGQLAATDVQGVFKSNPHIPTEQRCLGDQGNLMAPGRRQGPDIVVSKYVVSD